MGVKRIKKPFLTQLGTSKTACPHNRREMNCRKWLFCAYSFNTPFPLPLLLLGTKTMDQWSELLGHFSCSATSDLLGFCKNFPTDLVAFIPAHGYGMQIIKFSKSTCKPAVLINQIAQSSLLHVFCPHVLYPLLLKTEPKYFLVCIVNLNTALPNIFFFFFF